MMTRDDIKDNCEKIHLRSAKEYFKTPEFKKWVNNCIDLARENGVLYELRLIK